MDSAPDFRALQPYIAVDEPDEHGEWLAHCPLHEDSKPSAHFNFEKSVWSCKAGCPSGSIGELLYMLENLEDTEVEGRGTTGGFTASVIDISQARSRRKANRSKKIPLPSEGKVEGWHHALLSDKDRLSELTKARGLATYTVKKFKIGWDSEEEAYTIPFYDEGKLVNLRWYRLTVRRDEKKIWGVPGHNEARIFNYDSARGEDEIVIAEGEMDAMLLSQFGFAAVTGTGGSSVWKREWNDRFKGKTVYIVYDRDKPGSKGARRVARFIGPHCRAVFIVELPFDELEDGGKDVTDLWLDLKEEFLSEFKDLMRDARPVRSRQQVDDENKPMTVSVMGSFSSDNHGKAVEMKATVAGRTNPPYLVPKGVQFSCAQDAGEKCVSCPMNKEHNGSAEKEVEPTDPAILEMIGVSKKSLHDVVCQLVGARCRNRIFWDVKSYMNVEELFIRPTIEDDIEETDYASTRKVYSVGRHDTLPNTTVRVAGRILPNPKDQRSEFLAWDVDPTESSIDSFSVEPETHERLKVFQCAEGEKPLSKLADIARDLSSNVTHIYGRTDVHIAMDLVWHSVLKYHFEDRLVRKGWLELLVVGDTRTGKSETAMKLSSHYQTGQVISCESASMAGVLGGVQQFSGKEWTITWGAVPLNDRRLVILDEVSGLSTDEIGKMSSIRSSGIAEIIKIDTQRTAARTRLIWVGNPRNAHMGQFLRGVNAIPPLIGNPEDIARFDLAMVAASSDVESAEINRPDRDTMDHTYTSDLCRDRVLWAWSRKPHHVRWMRQAENEVYRQARKMGGQYVPSPPLVQAANVREKIMRLAVAIAAATYSSPDGIHLDVDKTHVRDAVKFLNHIYGKASMGYREASRQRLEDKKIADGSKPSCRKYLESSGRLARFLSGRVGHFRRQDMEEMLNISREEANAIISRLWDWRMVSKDEAGNIQAEPELNELLREMEDEL